MTKTSKKNDFVNPNTGRISITESFGGDLAALLANKISTVDTSFDTRGFVRDVKRKVIAKSYTQRVEAIADLLNQYLPEEYTDALSILCQILGPENKEETGMFSRFYWLLPVGKFIEKYGLDDFAESMKAIEEVTKRNTGEYAIRPFARKYPSKILAICKRWARSKNFHLRRLASEGLRPKLPWAPKLDVWNDTPWPIFEILELLKEDEVKFIKKSVANHVRDWLKVNPTETKKLIARWSKSKNKNTKWILKHALR